MIQTLNDIGWTPFEAVTSTGIIQCLAIGVVILMDKRPVPTFPRWLGYFNFWVAVYFAGGSVNMFFKDGPLAWPGVFAWYTPLGALTLWLIFMTWYMLRAVNASAAEATATAQWAVAGPGEAPSNAELAAGLAALRNEVLHQNRT